jgi:hypothetical protein
VWYECKYIELNKFFDPIAGPREQGRNMLVLVGHIDGSLQARV